MNIFQLNCFLTVAETLNFARAAERLNITQPAVTHQIRSLESELNVKLFRRSTRSVELTHAGIIFLDDAQKMVGIAIRAQKRFADPAKQEIQPFSIGFQSYTQLLYFPDIWRAMRRIYPNLHPGIRVAPVQHLRHLLEEETIEAFISFREPELQKSPSVTVRSHAARWIASVIWKIRWRAVKVCVPTNCVGKSWC